MFWLLLLLLLLLLLAFMRGCEVEKKNILWLRLLFQKEKNERMSIKSTYVMFLSKDI